MTDELTDEEFRDWIFRRLMRAAFGRNWKQKSGYEDKNMAGRLADRLTDGEDPYQLKRETSYPEYLPEDACKEIKARQVKRSSDGGGSA
ncbi:MAG: hypothetical protein SV253_10195 [Halobacteria archaeon]|nr:hypothetical protein [Halobacteria archaeon]